MSSRSNSLYNVSLRHLSCSCRNLTCRSDLLCHHVRAVLILDEATTHRSPLKDWGYTRTRPASRPVQPFSAPPPSSAAAFPAIGAGLSAALLEPISGRNSQVNYVFVTQAMRSVETDLSRTLLDDSGRPSSKKTVVASLQQLGYDIIQLSRSYQRTDTVIPSVTSKGRARRGKDGGKARIDEAQDDGLLDEEDQEEEAAVDTVARHAKSERIKRRR
jgi:hypothetical protein